jgi:hypothetical protein
MTKREKKTTEKDQTIVKRVKGRKRPKHEKYLFFYFF